MRCGTNLQEICVIDRIGNLCYDNRILSYTYKKKDVCRSGGIQKNGGFLLWKAEI